MPGKNPNRLLQFMKYKYFLVLVNMARACEENAYRWLK